MQAELIKTRVAFVFPLIAAVIFFGLPGFWPAVAAEKGEAFIVLPGEAPRYGGQQGREADITELLATADQTGGVLGIFRQTIPPKAGPPRAPARNGS